MIGWLVMRLIGFSHRGAYAAGLAPAYFGMVTTVAKTSEASSRCWQLIAVHRLSFSIARPCGHTFKLTLLVLYMDQSIIVRDYLWLPG